MIKLLITLLAFTLQLHLKCQSQEYIFSDSLLVFNQSKTLIKDSGIFDFTVGKARHQIGHRYKILRDNDNPCMLAFKKKGVLLTTGEPCQCRARLKSTQVCIIRFIFDNFQLINIGFNSNHSLDQFSSTLSIEGLNIDSSLTKSDILEFPIFRDNIDSSLYSHQQSNNFWIDISLTNFHYSFTFRNDKLSCVTITTSLRRE